MSGLNTLMLHQYSNRQIRNRIDEINDAFHAARKAGKWWFITSSAGNAMEIELRKLDRELWERMPKNDDGTAVCYFE